MLDLDPSTFHFDERDSLNCCFMYFDAILLPGKVLKNGLQDEPYEHVPTIEEEMLYLHATTAATEETAERAETGETGETAETAMKKTKPRFLQGTSQEYQVKDR